MDKERYRVTEEEIDRDEQRDWQNNRQRLTGIDKEIDKVTEIDRGIDKETDRGRNERWVEVWLVRKTSREGRERGKG